MPIRFARLLALSTLAFAFAASAQDGATVRLVVPSSPGSVADLVARTIAPPMAKALAQTIVVENVAGTGGVIGTERIVRAPKDGLTIGLPSSNHAINPGIYKSLPYDSLRDVTPIAVVATTPLVLVAHSSVPAKDLRELVALAKAKPGTVHYGSAGNGSVLHLAGVLLASEAGVELTHVPYKGFAPMLADLLGGQIQTAFAGVSTVAGHVKAGKLVALGISTPTRSPLLPDVRPLADVGVPGYSFDAWLALIGPAGLPKPVVERLNGAVRTALAAPEVQDVFTAQGVVAVGGTPDAAGTFFRAELDKHQRLVKRSGATLD